MESLVLAEYSLSLSLSLSLSPLCLVKDMPSLIAYLSHTSCIDSPIVPFLVDFPNLLVITMGRIIWLFKLNYCLRTRICPAS
ncbi:hypothetical protein BD560DRAFT_399847 [Blakeslea trispora]|nr:hypothetical protein BD560DRAFT_399847 [Blakeslea trispora]